MIFAVSRADKLVIKKKGQVSELSHPHEKSKKGEKKGTLSTIICLESQETDWIPNSIQSGKLRRNAQKPMPPKHTTIKET